MFGAKLLHRQFAVATIPRFARSGLVVNSRMQNTGIMARLMFGKAFFLFQNQDGSPRKPLRESVRRRQSDNAAANNNHIKLLHGNSAVPRFLCTMRDVARPQLRISVTEIPFRSLSTTGCRGLSQRGRASVWQKEGVKPIRRFAEQAQKKRS
jgi:hypothetical protein